MIPRSGCRQPGNEGQRHASVESDGVRQGSHHQSNRRESIIVTDASLFGRKVACEEGSEPMPAPKKTRALARSLVACEANASKSSLDTEPATVRVYERLRRQLGSPV